MAGLVGWWVTGRVCGWVAGWVGGWGGCQVAGESDKANLSQAELS